MSKSKDDIELALDVAPNVICFDGELQGRKFDFVYKGHSYFLLLPEFSKGQQHAITFDNSMVFHDWVYDTAHGDMFGSPVGLSGDEDDQEVALFVCDKLLIVCTDVQTVDDIRSVWSDLDEWLAKLISWLEVVKKVDLSNNPSTVSQVIKPETYSISNGQDTIIRGVDPVTINVVFNGWNAITEADLLEAIRLSNGDDPTLPYELLMSAIKARNIDKYRQSVLDAATSLEVCLKTLLDRELVQLTSVQKELFNRAYRDISGVISALTKFGYQVNKNDILIKNVSKPRNDAIHNGVQVTRAVADECLKTVENFLYKYLPY